MKLQALRLYELASGLDLVVQHLEDGSDTASGQEAQKETEAAWEAWKAWDEAFDVKVESTALKAHEAEATAKALDSEIRRLSLLKTTAENTRDSLKGYLKQALGEAGKRKVEGKLAKVWIQKNPVGLDSGEIKGKDLPFSLVDRVIYSTPAVAHFAKAHPDLFQDDNCTAILDTTKAKQFLKSWLAWSDGDDQKGEVAGWYPNPERMKETEEAEPQKAVKVLSMLKAMKDAGVWLKEPTHHVRVK